MKKAKNKFTLKDVKAALKVLDKDCPKDYPWHMAFYMLPDRDKLKATKKKVHKQ